MHVNRGACFANPHICCLDPSHCWHLIVESVPLSLSLSLSLLSLGRQLGPHGLPSAASVPPILSARVDCLQPRHECRCASLNPLSLRDTVVHRSLVDRHKEVVGSLFHLLLTAGKCLGAGHGSLCCQHLPAGFRRGLQPGPKMAHLLSESLSLDTVALRVIPLPSSSVCVCVCICVFVLSVSMNVCVSTGVCFCTISLDEYHPTPLVSEHFCVCSMCCSASVDRFPPLPRKVIHMLTLHSHSMIPVSYWEVADRRATRKQHQTFQQRKERTKNRVQQEDTHHLCCVSDEKCSTESRKNASLVFPTKTAQELRVLGRRMRFFVTSRGVRGPRRSSVMGS